MTTFQIVGVFLAAMIATCIAVPAVILATYWLKIAGDRIASLIRTE